MKIIKHIEPPIKDKLKAHYFDRYRPSIDGNKILSSVGDQSEGREIQPGRCYNFDGVDDYIAITSPDIGTLYVSGLDENGELNTTLTIGYFTNQYQISGSGKVWNIKVWTSNTATETQKKSYTLESGLFAWYKCDESTGINSYDSSGNGNHGMVTNSTTETFHSTQTIYSWQNEVGYSKDVSPIQGFEFNYDNWQVISGAWVFADAKAIHTAFGPNTQPVYFSPIESNLVAGVEYSITITVEETDGMVGFSVYGGVPSNARRNTPGQIVSKFTSNGDVLRMFTYENVSCVLSEMSIVAIGLVPAKDNALDVYGNPLHYKGQVAYNALAKQSNCLYLDGIDDVIQFADTTGWDRLENAGTSELSINGNNIEGTEGSVYNLRVYDGSDNMIHLFPCSEGGGVRINCVLGGTIGTLVNATLGTAWAKQDEYHYNIKEGYSKGKGFSTRVTDTRDTANTNYRYTSQEGVFYQYSYGDDANPSTGRFDPDGNPLGYTSEYFNFYKELISGGVTGGNGLLIISSSFSANTVKIDCEVKSGVIQHLRGRDNSLQQRFFTILNTTYGFGSPTTFANQGEFYWAISGLDPTYGESFPETVGFPTGTTSQELRDLLVSIGIENIDYFIEDLFNTPNVTWFYCLQRTFNIPLNINNSDGRNTIELGIYDIKTNGGVSSGNMTNYYSQYNTNLETYGNLELRCSSNTWVHFYSITIDENHVVPASQTIHNQDATGLKLENIAGRHHNGAETLIDFTGGIESPYAVQFELPNNYAFGDPIEYKEQANNIEKNILIYDGVDSGEDIRIKNFIKDI